MAWVIGDVRLQRQQTDPAIVQTGHLYKRVAGSSGGLLHPIHLSTPAGEWHASADPYPYPDPYPDPYSYSYSYSPPQGLSFASTAGVITSPFVNNGNTISQSIETLDPTQGGRALYAFNVTTAGDYQLSVMLNCPDEGSNSLFVNIDAEPSPAMIWSIPVTSGFEPRIASWPPGTTPKAWTLSVGTHQLIIRGREPGVIVGQITLAIPPDAPQGFH